jgi:hypothetical protein
VSAISYPDLPAPQISAALEEFYKRFYFRPKKIAEMTAEMLTSRQMLSRRLREGVEFFRFLSRREARM